jgi:O-antigen/teichoic acid export membrane protein
VIFTRTDGAPVSGKRSSLLADFLSTSAIQGVSVALNALSLGIISRRLGESDLGFYTLERRGMALVQPVVLLGLTVATPRFIALAIGRGATTHRRYEVAGLTMVVGIAGVVCAGMLAAPGPIARIFFGSSDAIGLARALAGFVFVTACFQVVYCVFRGNLRFLRANLLELTVVGAIPVAIALFGPTDLVAVMWMINIAIAAATLATSMPLASALTSSKRLLATLRREGRELLRFGLARTPGDLAVVGLFSLAPLAVVQTHSATEAGYTSIVQSSLNVVAVAAVALGFLLLPRVALDFARADESLAPRYALLAQATLDVSIGLAGLLFAASPLVIAFWLPSLPAQAITGQQIVALGLPGYVFYLVFRSYLDAVDTRPLSSMATLGGLAVLVALLALLLGVDTFEPTVSACLALAVGLCVTGAVTLALVNPRLGSPLNLRHHGLCLAALGLMVLAALTIQDKSLPIVGVFACLLFVAYFAVLFLMRPPWLCLLLSRLRAP